MSGSNHSHRHRGSQLKKYAAPGLFVAGLKKDFGKLLETERQERLAPWDGCKVAGSALKLFWKFVFCGFGELELNTIIAARNPSPFAPDLVQAISPRTRDGTVRLILIEQYSPVRRVRVKRRSHPPWWPLEW